MTHTLLYSSLKQKDIFTFFNLTEENIKKSESNPDLKFISLKPGGFQEHIDIEFHILEEKILVAYLLVDREWIGNEKNINSFAKDIIKSFLNDLFPDAIDQTFKVDLIQGIWDFVGKKDKVISLRQSPQKNGFLTADVQAFIDVFLNKSECAKLDFKHVKFKMENKYLNNKDRLIIRLNFIQ